MVIPPGKLPVIADKSRVNGANSGATIEFTNNGTDAGRAHGAGGDPAGETGRTSSILVPKWDDTPRIDEFFDNETVTMFSTTLST